MTEEEQRTPEPDEDGIPAGQTGDRPIAELHRERRAANGRETEDERFLQREILEPEFLHTDPWRVSRIMGEFVEGFDTLADWTVPCMATPWVGGSRCLRPKSSIWQPRSGQRLPKWVMHEEPGHQMTQASSRYTARS